MKKLEKTTIKGISAKCYTATKRGKQVYTAYLYDDCRNKIEGISATYTRQVGQTEIDAKKTAIARAVEMLQNKFWGLEFAAKGNAVEVKYYSKMWNQLSVQEREKFLEKSHRPDNRKNVITYFERNVLDLLDQAGPLIAPEMERDIAQKLYLNMLKGKKYKHLISNESEETECIEQFAQYAIEQLQGKSISEELFGKKPQKEAITTFVDDLCKKIISEERIRVLLAYYLLQKKRETTWKQIAGKALNNITILQLCAKAKISEKDINVLQDEVLFLLREICCDEQQSKYQVNKHLSDINVIMEAWCKHAEVALPTVRLPLFAVDKARQNELVKELPWAVRVKFAALLLEGAEKSWYCCAGAIMLAAGTRVAEVCALKYNYIYDMGDWGIAFIRYTVDGDEITQEGKNEYFRRIIFLPKFAMDVIHLRQNRLRKMGMSEEEIGESFVACRGDELSMPAQLGAFSGAIKDLLSQAGIGVNDWEDIQKAMVEEPDYDYFHRPEKFDTAYLLRRDATSMMCNTAKIEPLLVDAILGHKLPKNASKYNKIITREQEWPKIIAEMERIVYHPDHSCNPAYKQIEGQIGDIVNLQTEYPRFAIKNDSGKKLKVRITIKTTMGSDVQYRLPKESREKASMISLINSGGPKCCLSNTPTREEFKAVLTSSADEGESTDAK